MRHAVLLASVLVLFFPTQAWCDGGLLRISQENGGRRVSVFTSPTPLTVGWADVSILVQDEKGGTPAWLYTVSVTAAPLDDPSRLLLAEASAEAASNPL